MADSKRKKEFDDAEEKMRKMLETASDEELDQLREGYPSNMHVKKEWENRQKKRKEGENRQEKKKEGMTYDKSPIPPKK